MHRIYNKILVAFAITLILGGVYAYFAEGIGAQAADSSLASTSADPTADPSTVTNDKISQDTAFLYTLTSLTRIKIDDTLFKDTAFNSLVDNTVLLEAGIPGRKNPFSPITSNRPTTNAQVSPVITNAPAQVTKTTAILNGTTNNAQGVSSVNFQYGPTPLMGKFTIPAKQSLIGSYGTSILNLTPGTAYFFRAEAKVNGTMYYGDVISFNTN